MHWTSKNEQDIIKEWAAKEHTEIFAETYLSSPKKDETTYWEIHNEQGEISEHQFDTMMELQQILKDKFVDENMEDLILPLAVAAFKEKYKVDEATKNISGEEGQLKQENSADFSIPEFRYVF